MHLRGLTPARRSAAKLTLGCVAACVVLSMFVQVTVAAFFSKAANSGSTFATATSFDTCSGGAGTDWVTGLEHNYMPTGVVFTSTTGTATPDATVARNGSYSLRVTKTAGSIAYARKSGFPINGSTHALHFGFRVAALPAVDTTFAVLDQFSSDLFLKYKASTQRLTLQWGTDAPVEASGTLQANTWYRIEIKANTGTNPITAEWRIDGVEQTSISKAETGGAIGTIHFGTANSTDSAAYTAYYDDIVHSKSLSDYPFGDLHVSVMRPNGNGTHSNPTHFQHEDATPIDASSWTWLDDATMFGGTDELVQVTAGTSSYLEFEWDDPPESCVVGIQAYANSGSIGSSGNVTKMSVFDGATESVINSGSTGCGNCLAMRSVFVTPAATPWTVGRVEGLVLRLGYQQDPTPQTRFGAAMLEYAAP